MKKTVVSQYVHSDDSQHRLGENYENSSGYIPSRTQWSFILSLFISFFFSPVAPSGA
jgi:hypothetical protein